MSIETTTMSDQTTTMSIHTMTASLDTSTMSTPTGTNCHMPWPTDLSPGDGGCSAPIKGNLTDGFYYCCDEGQAYYSDCAVFCRAPDQSVEDLWDCLDDYTNENPSVRCATGLSAIPTPSSTSSGASGSETSSPSSANASATSSAASSATSPSASSTENAAFTNRPISTTGISVLAMLFCSAMMGLVA